MLGNGYVSSLDAKAAATFDQRYLEFLVGTQKEFSLGALLPGFSALDRWSKDRTYGLYHEIERELKNVKGN